MKIKNSPISNGLKAGLVVLISVLIIFAVVKAAPPGSPYNPGETLDPGCSPGDTNCTVLAPLSTLNGLSTSSQTFASSTTGTDFTITSSGSTHTFNLPSASALNRGLLTAADWTTFNSKEPAIAASGTSAYWRGDKTWQTLNQAAVAGLNTSDSPTFAGLTLTGLSGVLKAAAGLISGSATTNDLPEGTNLYWTQGRFDTAFSGKTTSNLAEGTNLYYTDTRARNALSGIEPITYNSTTGAIGLTTPLALTYGGTGTSTGSIIGTGALTFTAGGANQNVTLTPSGTGYTILNGNVGIGTSTPGAKLEIQGSGTDNGFKVYIDDDQYVKINQYGSLMVVMPTSSANWVGLGALGQGDTYARLGFGFDTETPFMGFGPGTAARDIFLRRESGDLAFTFGTTPSEKVRITSAGNVGIGLTSPGTKLEIASAASNYQSIRFNVNAGSGSQIYTNYAGTETEKALILGTYANAANQLVLATSGNVGIGTTGPEARLQVTGGGLCVGSDVNCNTDNNTEGVVYSSATAMTIYDVAENYPTKDTSLGAGEIVSLDKNFNGPFVKRAEQGEILLGAISTEPAVLLGGFNGPEYKEEHQVAVTLSGRIPVKVNLEGGEIEQGDRIALSQTPGIGKKAAGNEPTIGIALENYREDSTGEILVFVNLLSQSITFNPSPPQSGGESIFEESFAWILDQFKSLGVAISEGVVKAKEFIAEKITTKKLCLEGDDNEAICIDKNQLKALLEKNQISNPDGQVQMPNAIQNLNSEGNQLPAETVITEEPATEEPLVEEPSLGENPDVTTEQTPAETSPAEPLDVAQAEEPVIDESTDTP
ncbi:MAG: hypothetical protein AB1643_01645 [Patescibacteria group bacterium]